MDTHLSGTSFSECHSECPTIHNTISYYTNGDLCVCVCVSADIADLLYSNVYYYCLFNLFRKPTCLPCAAFNS